MYRVYTCLAQQHDRRLVLVAGLTRLLASWTALLLARRGPASERQTRPLWLAAAATVTSDVARQNRPMTVGQGETWAPKGGQ